MSRIEEEAVQIFENILNGITYKDIMLSQVAISYMACMRGLGTFKQAETEMAPSDTINTVIGSAIGLFIPYISSLIIKAMNVGAGEIRKGTMLLGETYVKTEIYHGQETLHGVEFDAGGIGTVMRNWVREFRGLEPVRPPILAAVEKILKKEGELRGFRDATILRHICALIMNEQAHQIPKSGELDRIAKFYPAGNEKIEIGANKSDSPDMKSLMLLALGLRQMEKTIKSFKTKWAHNTYKGTSKIKEKADSKHEDRSSFLRQSEAEWNRISRDREYSYLNASQAETIQLAIEFYTFHRQPEFLERLANKEGIDAKVSKLTSLLPGTSVIAANKVIFFAEANISVKPEKLGEVIALRHSEDYGMLLSSWHNKSWQFYKRIYSMIRDYAVIAKVVSDNLANATYLTPSVSEFSKGKNLQFEVMNWLFIGMANYLHRRYLWLNDEESRLFVGAILLELFQLSKQHEKLLTNANTGIGADSGWLESTGIIEDYFKKTYDDSRVMINYGTGDIVDKWTGQVVPDPPLKSGGSDLKMRLNYYNTMGSRY